MAGEPSQGQSDALGFSLALPAGYRWEEILAFHGRDDHSVSERVSAQGLTVALVSEGQPVAVTVHRGPGIVFCSVEASTPCAKAPLKIQVRRMLGLTSDPAAWEAAAPGLPVFAPLVARRPGLRIPLTPTPFEALAWAVMGQQVSRRSASAMRRRLVANLGRPVGVDLLTFPTADAIAGVAPSLLQACGFSAAKATTLSTLAQAVASGALDLASLAAVPADTALNALTRFRGIGPWSARYTLLRGIGSPDCAPVGDAVLAGMLGRLLGQATPASPARFEAALAPCAPWRSFAACHLWAEADAQKVESSATHPAYRDATPGNVGLAEPGDGGAGKPRTMRP